MDKNSDRNNEKIDKISDKNNEKNDKISDKNNTLLATGSTTNENIENKST